MIKIIDESGDTDRGRHLIAEKINDIAQKENSLLRKVDYILKLCRRIENFDLRSFRGLKSRLSRLPEREKEYVREEIRQEKDKIISEERLRQVHSELTQHDKDFQYCLKMAAATLSAGQPGQARDWIEKAVDCEQRALKMFEEMQEVEGKLLSLTKKEYKAFKREKAFAQEG